MALLKFSGYLFKTVYIYSCWEADSDVSRCANGKYQTRKAFEPVSKSLLFHIYAYSLRIQPNFALGIRFDRRMGREKFWKEN